MEIKWKIRDYLESDRGKFIAWRNIVDKRKIEQDFFNWQYYLNPFGPVDTWVADDGEKIVGQYTIQKQEYFYYGKKIIGSLAFDLATHPDYRYQGMFTKLGFHSLEKAGNRNISFTLGYPWVNGIAIPGHKKVGWTLLGKLKIYENSNLDNYNFEEIHDYSIRKLKIFDERFDVLALEHREDCPIMLNRTGSFLNWRYFQKVGYSYYCHEILDNSKKLIGFFVLKIYEEENTKILHIIDFILPNNKLIYRKLLNFAFDFAIKQNADKVNLIINKNLGFYGFLKQNGFGGLPRYFIPIVHINNSSVDLNKMNDLNYYYFTMGDNDIF